MLLNAQPSGGPYGPVKQSWPLPQTGDTCRTGNLILNQGITIQPYGDEQPVLKGTYVDDKWMDLRNATICLATRITAPS